MTGTGKRRAPPAHFYAGHFKRIADIIAEIPEPDVRQVVANHFAQRFNAVVGGFQPGFWQAVTGGKISGPNRLDGDSPGIPAEEVVAPRTDLMVCTLQLWPPNDDIPAGGVTVIGQDYAANGRVFKWLQGQVALAKRKIHGREA